jgi:hypothetical protein
MRGMKGSGAAARAFEQFASGAAAPAAQWAATASWALNELPLGAHSLHCCCAALAGRKDGWEGGYLLGLALDDNEGVPAGHTGSGGGVGAGRGKVGASQKGDSSDM